MPIYETERFIRVPESIAEAHRIIGEQRRLAQRKRDARKDPSHGKVHIPLQEKPFIVWDGEGPQDTGYSLLGNSEGEEICYPHLRTRDCLNLLLESAQAHPQAIHVSFGFTYDVSCILWELGWRHFHALHKFNRTIWHDYQIEHIPRKWFWVKRGEISIKIFDIQSFFATSLVTALEKWNIGPWKNADSQSVLAHGFKTLTTVPPMSIVSNMSEKELVETFKKLRSEFLWKDISQIRLYMRLELKYSKVLINDVRSAFVSAGYCPRSWHGPGAVARMAFQRHNIYDVLAECPASVQIASRYAFIAGRFELFKAGHINGCVYCADINSAYPYFCSLLPNLSRGRWRQSKTYEPGKFAVYHIRYASKPDAYACHPLPFRDRHGMISWPHQVTGWYWNPEADLVANNPDAEFIDGWIFDEDDPSDRPFAWLRTYFAQRQQWKTSGNPAEYTLKLIINSIYGQLAQRTGWDRKNNKPPKTHQLEFAGWITSSCRAMVYREAIRCGSSLISIDTDGISSLEPFTWLEDSKELGGWELTEFSDAIYWQSGIYCLKEGGEWTKAKTRGIPKGSYTVEDLFTALSTNTPLRLTKKVFISYGLALQGLKKTINTWRDEPHEYQFGGAGKRFHYVGGEKRTVGCPDICGIGTIHKLALPSLLYTGNNESYPHKLPWLGDDMTQKDYLTNLIFYDRNDLEFDEEWVLTE